MPTDREDRAGRRGRLRRAVALIGALGRHHDRPVSRRPERNPDEIRFESLDDWILFGPRMR
jgi:hypothetical protein